MKIGLVHILISCLSVAIAKPTDSWGQEILEKRISVDFLDTEIKDALTTLGDQIDVKFAYSPTLFSVSRKVTLHLEDMKLSDVLSTMLNPHISYRVVGRHIALNPGERPIIDLRRSDEINGLEAKSLRDLKSIGEVLHLRISLLPITGRITSETGEGLPGANVLVKGTTQGTITDINGNFSLDAEQGAVLQISSIGYKTVEVTVESQTTINIRMQVDITQLSEIVVTGYTTQQKRDIIGSVSVVRADAIQATPSNNVLQQLQGRAAGVSITTTGEPGASGNANIRIRGVTSFGNDDVLYIVDGVPTTDPSRFNPQDIESMQVLKDASSAAIYGARAANGVIIITTKQGKADQTSISYNGYVAASALPYNRVPELLNTQQMMEYLQAVRNPGTVDAIFGTYGSYSIPERIVFSPTFRAGVPASDPRTNPDLYDINIYPTYQIFETSPGTDYFKAASQTAMVQQHQISASGGTDRSTYAMGMNYANEEGIYVHTGYERFSLRLNTNFKATDFLSFGENLQIASDNRSGGGGGGAWSSAFAMMPYVPVYDIMGGFGGSAIGGALSGVNQNPVAQLFRQRRNFDKTLRVFGNAYAEIKPFDFLTARSSIGIDARNGYSHSESLKEYEKSEPNRITSVTEEGSRRFNWTWSNTLAFDQQFADHDVKLLLGTEAIENNNRNVSGFKSGHELENPDFLSLNYPAVQLQNINVTSGNNTTTLFSVFGRLDYGFNDKYLFNVTVRRDGASVFGPNTRYGVFPSAAVAWRISEESFMNGMGWLDDLKLRGGWGRIGSIANVDQGNQFTTFASNLNNNYYGISGAQSSAAQGYGAGSVGNPNAKWESTETINVGLDMSLLQGVVDVTLDVYQKDTDDLLIRSLRNGLQPIVTQPFVNFGTMRNKGFDLLVGNRGTIAGDWGYDATVTFTHYKNELVKLNQEGTDQLSAAGGRVANALIRTEGEPFDSFYGWVTDGFYDDAAEVASGPTINGSPGSIGTWRYQDVNGDNNINSEDRQILGNPYPDFEMGLNLSVNYKAFDLTAFLFWKQGHDIFNYTKYTTYMGVLAGNQSVEKVTGAWTPENPGAAKTPALRGGYTSFVTSNSLDFYIEDGSYLSGRTFQLGYSVPSALASKAKIKSLRLYAQGQNLFLITKYTGADPNLNSGVDTSGYPNPRQFLLGLNVSF